MRVVVVVAACVSVVFAGGCASASFVDVSEGFDDAHKRRALQLISVFENGTPELQYDYTENLDDGRGFTCGLGFTTGTGDALVVVERYTERVPDNALAPFLPELRRLKDLDEGEGSDDVSGLDGFAAAWAAAAADEAPAAKEFRAVSDAVTDEQSYLPALAHLNERGLHSGLALMVLYDTVWMHGDGDDGDGTAALLDRTGADTGADSADEAAFVDAFLAVRRADLEDPEDPATADEWGEAVSRVDVLDDISAAGNFDFDGPIDVGAGFDVTIE